MKITWHQSAKLYIKLKTLIFTWAFSYCLWTVRFHHVCLFGINANWMLVRHTTDQYWAGFVIIIDGWHNNYYITASIMLHGIIVNVLRWYWAILENITNEPKWQNGRQKILLSCFRSHVMFLLKTLIDWLNPWEKKTKIKSTYLSVTRFLMRLPRSE